MEKNIYVVFEEIPFQNRFVFAHIANSLEEAVIPHPIHYNTSFGPVRIGLSYRKHNTPQNTREPNTRYCVPEAWSYWYQTKNIKFLKPDVYLPLMTEENDLILYLRGNFSNTRMDYFDTMLFSCHLDYIKHQTKSQVVLDYIAGHENNCTLLNLLKKVHTPLNSGHLNRKEKAVIANEGVKYYQHEKFEMAKRFLHGS